MMTRGWRAWPAIEERMLLELGAWIGTRYASGQRCRGVVADCVGFVFGAIDGLDGRPRAQAPSMPRDVAFHSPEDAERALRALRELYEPVRALGPEALLEPGDVLVVGPKFGGPGHAMLVGPEPRTIWHCTPGAGVHRAGWCLGDGYEVLHGAFRMDDRAGWLA